MHKVSVKVVIWVDFEGRIRSGEYMYIPSLAINMLDLLVSHLCTIHLAESSHKTTSVQTNQVRFETLLPQSSKAPTLRVTLQISREARRLFHALVGHSIASCLAWFFRDFLGSLRWVGLS